MSCILLSLDGHILHAGYNAPKGDYGYVIVTSHLIADGEGNTLQLYALYGHLSAKSVVGRKQGDTIAAGETLGWIGAEHENGGWSPHVHFQLSLVSQA